MKITRRCIWLAVAALMMTTPVNAQTITGRASVIDGDTIEIRGQRVRLHAIDAPESSQTCLDAGGRSYRCGQQAAFAVADQIGQRNVSCRQTDTDRYRRVIAVCDLNGVDLNGWMVSVKSQYVHTSFNAGSQRFVRSALKK